MSQQQMNFDQDNRDALNTYEPGYQETAHDNDSASHFSEQKLLQRDTARPPTAGQRLALAIVSLLVIFFMALAVMVLAATGVLVPNMTANLVSMFTYMFLSLLAAVIVVNVLFNRKH